MLFFLKKKKKIAPCYSLVKKYTEEIITKFYYKLKYYVNACQVINFSKSFTLFLLLLLLGGF